MNKELVKTDGDIIRKLFVIEEGLKKLPQVSIPKRHYFSSGIYAREIDIAKGSLIIGMLHKHSQINIVSKGEISVLTEDGWKRVKAPYTFESPAGTKRAGYAHEDTVWTTFIGTEEKDPEKMDDLLTIGSYQEFLEVKTLLLQEEKTSCHS